ncbi:hypothetical protein C8J57DRAFT_1354542, partial [Mycena rebaudengoi]
MSGQWEDIDSWMTWIIIDGLPLACDGTAPPITHFQLATHMSGLRRDWPPGNVANWPKAMIGAGPPPTNGPGLPFPTQNLLSAPSKKPTRIGVLGLALVAANRLVNGKSEPSSYAALLKKDIFGPLGLNESHFLTTEFNKHFVVVPSLAPPPPPEVA